MFLLRRLLMLENVTRVHNRSRIDGDISFVDLLNDAFLVDEEGGAIAKALCFVEDAVVFNYCAFEIAEDGKRDSKLFSEFTVGGNTVDTHSKDLSFVFFEFGETSLVRLHLLRSTTGEGKHIDRQYDVLLALEVT